MVSEDDNLVDTSIPFLSHLTYREWHAFVNGFYRGLTAVSGENAPAEQREKHYWRAGFIAGWTVKVLVIVKIGPWAAPLIP